MSRFLIAIALSTVSLFAQQVAPNEEQQDQSPTLNKRAMTVTGLWTVDTLREHISSMIDANDRRYSARFDAQEKAVMAALKSAEQAVLKAESASEKRFESVNEFRKTLTDQTATFIPRGEYSASHGPLVEKVQLLDQKFDRIEARSGGLSAAWVLIGQGVSLLAGVVGIFLALNRPSLRVVK